MKRFFSFFLALILLGACFNFASAQNLSFQVDRQEVLFFANQDGTVSIEYKISFINNPSGAKIDFIDIGVPKETYVLKTVVANVDGKPITDIQKSDFTKSAIAFGLGNNAIQPGKSGVVNIRIGTLTKLIYNTTEKETEKYASFQFSPSSFDSKSVTGKTDMTVALILPPGLKQEEPRYFTPQGWPGAAKPESNFDNEGRAYYRWHATNANAYSTYIFGASFPARLVAASSLQNEPKASVNIDEGTICCIGFGLLFAAIFGFGLYGNIWGAKKRKLQYLPPKIAVEGHGIKRGLTAIEAAILMEQPMDKILTMILFAVIKKGAAAVAQRDPLKLNITQPPPEGLQPYEREFLDAMQQTDKLLQRRGLQDMMINLVKSVSEKMRGFSRKESIDYYEQIMRKAWEQVELAQTPDMKMQKFDEGLDWTMLDRKFEDRTRTVFVPGPVYVPPTWWGRYDPTYSRPAPSTASLPQAGGASLSLPHLPGSDFAASMVNGVQSWSAGVVGDITNFTTGITNKTNPVPVSTTGKSGSGWSGRSGGGCVCACACACAGCACACAGGGR